MTRNIFKPADQKYTNVSKAIMCRLCVTSGGVSMQQSHARFDMFDISKLEYKYAVAHMTLLQSFFL